MLTRIKDSIADVVTVALMVGLFVLGGAAVFAAHAINVVSVTLIAVAASASKSRAAFFGAGLALGLLIGCPGGGEEPSVEASEGSCCACLFDAFPAPGEPCIYTSTEVCAERLKSNDPQHIDTWAVCLADLCADVCEGLGPFDIVGGAP